MLREKAYQELVSNAPYDIIVIGGGATGAGIVLDAASRGLKAALIEKNDFAEGTSGRSTKLVHGGVRYLELAVKHFDKVQYNLVKDALFERGILLKNAPHLVKKLTLVTPLYKWYELPYIYAGLTFYDILAGVKGLGRSRLLSKKNVLSRFSVVHEKGLKGGVLYYDGHFNDARTNISIALTAVKYGAYILNHTAAVSLLKESGKVKGVVVKDKFTGKEQELPATCVVNATGPFIDGVRRMDNPDIKPMIQVSSGIHIVLDKKFILNDTGLMIPKTEDGRVLFILPWEGRCLVGTTDEAAQVNEHPLAKEKDVDYLLRHINKYFDIAIKKEDIKAVWSGLRPLVSDPKAADTARLARDHVLEISDSGLFSIAGGKWTTYRKMALDVVDNAVKKFDLKTERGCITDKIFLYGGDNYDKNGAGKLVKDFNLDINIAEHLNNDYGDKSQYVAKIASEGYGDLLAEGFPYIEAEVIYAVRHEYAMRAIDFLARRVPLALLDQFAAEKAAHRTVELMGQELNLNEAEIKAEIEDVTERLNVSI